MQISDASCSQHWIYFGFPHYVAQLQRHRQFLKAALCLWILSKDTLHWTNHTSSLRYTCVFFLPENFRKMETIGEANRSFSRNGTNETDYSDYSYYYDYDESVNNIPLEEFVPVAIVYGLTLVLGVVGNLLVIFSISRYRRMQSVTNIFLVSLSSADLILILICVPIKVRKCFIFLLESYRGAESQWSFVTICMQSAEFRWCWTSRLPGPTVLKSKTDS